MENKTKLLDVPHKELIRENETIKLSSLFDFKGGHEELFPFLLGCQQANCDVIFENEGITIYADDSKNDPIQNMVLSMYMWVVKDPKIVTDYVNYLTRRK